MVMNSAYTRSPTSDACLCDLGFLGLGGSPLKLKSSMFLESLGTSFQIGTLQYTSYRRARARGHSSSLVHAPRSTIAAHKPHTVPHRERALQSLTFSSSVSCTGPGNRRLSFVISPSAPPSPSLLPPFTRLWAIPPRPLDPIILVHVPSSHHLPHLPAVVLPAIV